MTDDEYADTWLPALRRAVMNFEEWYRKQYFMDDSNWFDCKSAWNESRKQALEEAAKVAERFYEQHYIPTQLIKEIRALKENSDERNYS